MRAAWYERQGEARDVLVIGEMPDPIPSVGEVRIRVAASGINPGDIKKRQNAFGYGMPYPRVIPHSDGAGTADMVADRVNEHLLGKRVWCFGAQSYRPLGTAAEFVVVPSTHVIPLSDDVSFDVGATLGIPGITAHRAVMLGGQLRGRKILIHGGAGAVGWMAIALAHHEGAHVIATVRSENDVEFARAGGAADVLVRGDGLLTDLKRIAPDGVDHIIDVAFGSNIALNAAILAQGGSIAAYASNDAEPSIPFWPLLFQNATICLVGSDDVRITEKQTAARAINVLLDEGWTGPLVAERFALDRIAEAHDAVENGTHRGRIILTM